MEQLIKPITLEIDKDLWKRFKELIPRTEKLNDAVIKLIEKEVNISIEMKGGLK